MLVILILIVTVVILFRIYKTQNEDYWKRRNIPYNKPFPIVGEKMMLGLCSISDEFLENYNRFSNEPFFGGLTLGNPALTIKDPELIREITTKSFDHFIDHADIVVDEKLDPLLAANLVFLRGKQWKDMRSMMSPLFTGRKMRIMLELVTQCCQMLVDDLTKKAQSEKPVILEVKSLFSRLTSDITATCAFGIKCDSVLDENNEFYKKTLHFSTLSAIRFIITSFFKKICIITNFGLIQKSIYEYFRQFVYETIKIREERNIYRPDMIQLMIQARKDGLHKPEDDQTNSTEFSTVKKSENYRNKATSKIDLTNEDILAQVLLFILAGHETSSSALAFAAYELAINSDIQKKLQSEIDEELEKSNGNITYENLNDLKYLDMVISETLRRYPPGPLLNRSCCKDFEINKNGYSLKIEKGLNIIVPVIGLHHDPKYFSDPYKFDPERFSSENRKNITDFTYMPFGVGPRNCIGSRFALMQMKLALVMVLSKFDICVCSKTQIPIRYKKTPIRVAPEKGSWVEFKLRIH